MKWLYLNCGKGVIGAERYNLVFDTLKKSDPPFPWVFLRSTEDEEGLVGHELFFPPDSPPAVLAIPGITTCPKPNANDVTVILGPEGPSPLES